MAILHFLEKGRGSRAKPGCWERHSGEHNDKMKGKTFQKTKAIGHALDSQSLGYETPDKMQTMFQIPKELKDGSIQ